MKNIQLCTGGLWGEKGKKFKNLKKKKKAETPCDPQWIGSEQVSEKESLYVKPPRFGG